MKHFSILLTITGSLLLILGIISVFLPFNPLQFQNIIASDGVIDSLAQYAFQDFSQGLLIAGCFMLSIAGVYYLILRGTLDILRLKTGRYLALVLGLQFVFSLIYIYSFEYKVSGDAVWYQIQAENLATGRGILDNSGQPTAFWPIGYPYILAIIYRIFSVNIKFAQFFNIFVLLGITVLTYLIGTKLFNSNVARKAALIMALFPSQIFYSLTLISDSTFAFLVLLLLYLFIQPSSYKNTVTIGIVFGISLYFRPVIILFPVLYLAFRIIRDDNWKLIIKQVVLIGIIGEAILLPWQIRNYRVFGDFVFSATYGGYNLWMGNNPKASGGVVAQWMYIPQDTLNWMNRELSETERDRFCREQALRYIISHPLRTILLMPTKLIHLYLKDSKCITYGFTWSFEQVKPTVLMTLIAITEGVYYALGITFLLSLKSFLKRENAAAIILFLGTILYFSLIYLPFTGDGRYHQPLIPVFALVICLDVHRFKLNSKRV